MSQDVARENDLKKRAGEALACAQELRKATSDWIELYNALYGIGGKLSELFPTEAERVAFTGTYEYQRIAKLLDGLCDEAGEPLSLADDLGRVNGTISVRLPRSLHAALLAEAKAEGVSLNQLCLTKLGAQMHPDETN